MIIKRVIIEAVTKDIALKQKTSKDDEISFPFKINSLSQLLPQGITCIAESGILNSKDVSKIVDWGYSGALIGTALMQTNNPESTLIDFRKTAEEAQK